MKLSSLILSNLTKSINGDNNIFPYLTHKELYILFQGFSPRGVDSSSQESRGGFTLRRINDLNDSEDLKKLFEIILRPSRFKGDNKNQGTMNLEKAVEHFNGIIKEEGYIAKFNEKKRFYEISALQDNQEPILETHFEEIQKKIIEHLDSAKFLIWIAVAWFTDETLFKKLMDKKAEGLVIQVIVADKRENDNFYNTYSKEFQMCKLPVLQEGKKGIMHHKFCIIDLEKVINGSYNWTNAAADRNIENVMVIEDTDEVKSFASEFINLRKRCLEILSVGKGEQ